jgi:hypothetical protein
MCTRRYLVYKSMTTKSNNLDLLAFAFNALRLGVSLDFILLP